MMLNGREYSEPEIKAYISEVKNMLGNALKEIHKLGYEDCFSCIHKGACAFADDCHYRWEFADRVERLLK